MLLFVVDFFFSLGVKSICFNNYEAQFVRYVKLVCISFWPVFSGHCLLAIKVFVYSCV